MTLRKLGEIGVTLGAAVLVGLDTLQHQRKEAARENKKSIFRHIAFYSSLAAAGLALWEMKKHRHLRA